jgi:guanylate kinase
MVVNDELQRALTELRGIVLAEGCKQWRVAARAESLLQQ